MAVEKDLTPTNTEGTEGQENQEAGAVEKTEQSIQPTVDWEVDTNPYKKRYGDSQSQVQPLVRTLQQFAEYDHNTRVWKPKTQPVATPPDADFEKILEGYDPEFKKALSGYTQKQIKDALTEFKKESAFLSEYNSKVLDGRSKSLEEFGDEFDFAKNGKMNTGSPLYQLANEIIHSKYAVFNPDGTFAKYSNPEAEYLATVEAYAILTKRAKQQTPDKNKLNAIAGKGTKSAGVKKQLTYDEYRKLPIAEQDVYDLSQMGGQQ